jgi:hypothetical protein
MPDIDLTAILAALLASGQTQELQVSSGLLAFAIFVVWLWRR